MKKFLFFIIFMLLVLKFMTSQELFSSPKYYGFQISNFFILMPKSELDLSKEQRWYLAIVDPCENQFLILMNQFANVKIEQKYYKDEVLISLELETQEKYKCNFKLKLQSKIFLRWLMK